ncbi:hypothetical protein K450DRAFT_213300 [Umbelopsis ramanniana AG]|uniref:Elongation factor Ts, mitochondrial n=1 Tax=Umbelopsis ramanniana AG TaxID=1314678 RepID=A0AAD5HC22_UMBRA|nr:uncharacterized protein K450DRAFT_213300 [Umbelopsis ramanniana AG]KAI8577111.1 hypothetical protein K450DRAFT_213300 [Umbelopsis ramanniana AG]
MFKAFQLTYSLPRCAALSPALVRYASTANGFKPSIKLLAKLRQETEVSMSKAKEALVKAENDYEKALAWLEEDAKVSGAKKAQKVAGRTAGEGLIAIATVEAPGRGEGGVKSRSTIIELNCETDFVSRNDLFKNLATQIASTSLFVPDVFQNLDKSRFIHHIPVESFINSPIMPHPSSASADAYALFKTVQESIVETIGKLGENITLRRVAVVADPESELQQIPKQHDRTILASAYTHGGDSTTGKIGGIAVLGLSGGPASSPALSKLSRNVARQVVGFNPTFLNESQAVVPEGADKKEFLETNVLTHQNYMLGGGTVEEVVAKTGKDEGVDCEVIDYVRWEVGEGIEKAEQDFAGEVLRAVKGN